MRMNGKRLTPWMCTLAICGCMGLATQADAGSTTTKVKSSNPVNGTKVQERQGEKAEATEKSEATGAKASGNQVKRTVVVKSSAAGAKASKATEQTEATEKGSTSEQGVDPNRLDMATEATEKSDAVGAKASQSDASVEASSKSEAVGLRARAGSTQTPMPGKPSFTSGPAAQRSESRSPAPGKPSMVRQGQSTNQSRSATPAPGKPSLSGGGSAAKDESSRFTVTEYGRGSVSTQSRGNAASRSNDQSNRSSYKPSQARPSAPAQRRSGYRSGSSTPAKARGVEYKNNISLDSGGNHSFFNGFDAAYPSDNSGQALPVILFLDGSGSSNRGLIESMASEGFFVASVTLRTSNMDVNDAYQACNEVIDHIASHASEYNVDANRIGVWGNAAGGHLASMLGTASNSRSFRSSARGASRHAIRCVVTMGAPSDLTQLTETNGGLQTLRNWYGNDFNQESRDLATWSPMAHVDRADAAFLIFHGTNDSVVPFEQAKQMSQMLSQNNVSVQFQPLKGQGHRLNPAESFETASTFFSQHLGGSRQASASSDRSSSRQASASRTASSGRDAVIITSANSDADVR